MAFNGAGKILAVSSRKGARNRRLERPNLRDDIMLNHRHIYAVVRPLAGHIRTHHPAAWRNLNAKRIDGAIARWDYRGAYPRLEFLSPDWTGIDAVCDVMRDVWEARHEAELQALR